MNTALDSASYTKRTSGMLFITSMVNVRHTLNGRRQTVKTLKLNYKTDNGVTVFIRRTRVGSNEPNYYASFEIPRANLGIWPLTGAMSSWKSKTEVYQWLYIELQRFVPYQE